MDVSTRDAVQREMSLTRASFRSLTLSLSRLEPRGVRVPSRKHINQLFHVNTRAQNIALPSFRVDGLCLCFFSRNTAKLCPYFCFLKNFLSFLFPLSFLKTIEKYFGSWKKLLLSVRKSSKSKRHRKYVCLTRVCLVVVLCPVVVARRTRVII